MSKLIFKIISPLLQPLGKAVSFGTNFCFFSGEWVSQQGIPNWAFPMIERLFMFTCLVAVYFYHDRTGLPVLTIPVSYQIFFIVITALLYEQTRRSGPGYVNSSNSQIKPENISKFNYCETCLIPQPYRAFHCRKCDKCIERFDHHSIWGNVCIGACNLRWWLLYQLTLILSLLFTSASSYSLSTSSSSSVESLLSFLFAALTGFWIFPVIGLLVTLIIGASRNASTAELKSKLPGSGEYMKYNPYFSTWDLGSDFNLRQTFSGYSEERHRWSEPTHLGKLIAKAFYSQSVQCADASCKVDHGGASHKDPHGHGGHSSGQHSHGQNQHSDGQNQHSHSKSSNQMSSVAISKPSDVPSSKSQVSGLDSV